MPKNLKFILKLDLLKPQSSPQKLLTKFFNWALSAGRYLIILVEIIVLSAFLARFKLDGELADTKEAIENQIPYIESLAPDEAKIRKLQFQITSIKERRKQAINYPEIFEAVAAQTPKGVSLANLSLENNLGGLTIKITGRAANDLDLSSFTTGLKQDQRFGELQLKSISLEQGSINFSITGPILNNFSKNL